MCVCVCACVCASVCVLYICIIMIIIKALLFKIWFGKVLQTLFGPSDSVETMHLFSNAT